MSRFFLSVHRFLGRRRWAVYLFLLATTALFAFFASRITLVEDISELLPRSSMDSELAFGEIGLKDKIFLQVTTAEGAPAPLSTADLAYHMDAFVDSLGAADPDHKYIKGIFASLDIGDALGALDFAVDHLATLVDTTMYGEIQARLEPGALAAQMSENYHLVQEDMDGQTTSTVAMDPLNLRSVLLGSLLEDGGSVGEYTVEEAHFFCPDKTVAMGFLSPNFTTMESGKATGFYKLYEKVRTAYQAANPDVEVLAHGNPMSSVSNASTIKGDILLTIGASLLLILAVLLFCFKSGRFLVNLVWPVVYGAVFALACMYWLKGGMSLISLGISAIILGVALSYCLHVLVHHFHTRDTERVVREESVPVLLGCLTTVGAFMGLLFTESELLRDFGLFSTFALLGSTFAVLFILPHFLGKDAPADSPVQERSFKAVDKFNSLPWDSNPWILGAMGLVVLVGLVGSPWVKFDSDLRNLDFDRPSLVRSQDLYEAKNHGDGRISLYFAAYGEDLDSALENNLLLHSVLDSLRAEGKVGAVPALVPTVFLPASVQQERIDAWNAYWTPARRQEAMAAIGRAARSAGLDPEMFGPFEAILEASYEPGDLYGSGLVPPEMLSNLIEKDASGRYLVFTNVSFTPEDADPVTDKLTSTGQTIVLEPFYYCRDMVEIIHDDFSTTVWISSLFVFLVLLVAFRRLWVALTAFLPMFLSWFVMQGLMALTGLEFNLVNIVISTFVYGIGVDYSIFVMEGLLEKARGGGGQKLAYHKTAIFFSALVLVVVMLSLVFASHPAIHSIGLITFIGMTTTILLTYSLEPLVFKLLARKFGKNL